MLVNLQVLQFHRLHRANDLWHRLRRSGKLQGSSRSRRPCFHPSHLFRSQETLTRHKPMVAEYLEANYDRVRPPSLFDVPQLIPQLAQFFSSYALLVQSSNYVTKRQSLKLLGEILLDRTNFKVMTRYIANEDNLKMMMNLLKDRSKNIQFEAFHVFKVRCSLASLSVD